MIKKQYQPAKKRINSIRLDFAVNVLEFAECISILLSQPVVPSQYKSLYYN